MALPNGVIDACSVYGHSRIVHNRGSRKLYMGRSPKWRVKTGAATAKAARPDGKFFPADESRGTGHCLLPKSLIEDTEACSAKSSEQPATFHCSRT